MIRKRKTSNGRKTPPEKQRDNRANQRRDNRANQLNPNNVRYWKARGHDKPPKTPYRETNE